MYYMYLNKYVQEICTYMMKHETNTCLITVRDNCTNTQMSACHFFFNFPHEFFLHGHKETP
jgi:hypothetical protein